MIEEVQQTLTNLVNSNVSNTQLIYDFNLFDKSVTQKLWSTENYCKNLISLDVNKFWVQPSESDTQSAGFNSLTQAPTFDIIGYCRQFNLLLDGFFMNSMSTLDTLAHEISILYSLGRNLDNIYITNINSALNQNLKISGFIRSQLNLVWFSNFKNYRHCTTHESLIRISDIDIRFDQDTNRFKLIKKIKLPDNPKIRPFTYEKARIPVTYCESSLKRIQSFVVKAYKDILIDIQRNNNNFPI